MGTAGDLASQLDSGVGRALELFVSRAPSLQYLSGGKAVVPGAELPVSVSARDRGLLHFSVVVVVVCGVLRHREAFSLMLTTF